MVPLDAKEFNAIMEQTAYIFCIYILSNCPPFLLCNIKLSHVIGCNISSGRCVKIKLRTTYQHQAEPLGNVPLTFEKKIKITNITISDEIKHSCEQKIADSVKHTSGLHCFGAVSASQCSEGTCN